VDPLPHDGVGGRARGANRGATPVRQAGVITLARGPDVTEAREFARLAAAKVRPALAAALPSDERKKLRQSR